MKRIGQIKHAIQMKQIGQIEHAIQMKQIEQIERAIQMKQIEQIERAIQWIEDGALLDGSIFYVPRLLRDEVWSYCFHYFWDRFRDEATVDAIDLEQISHIVGWGYFNYNQLDVDLRCYLSYLGEWLQDHHKELTELHEEITGVV